ncbi:ricin-type beta-trefoil lectin domain protein [Actinocrinis puniceicyclus]|uniref:Ricin-type beta-trefoil lectin domain protein n=1 Tax=Actinocrinis puniceicyclus TaxID=977794 RepID=A0A8J7WQZ4_9ACTN|nr:ricin-type beta-trefoil lectin domain protein [Actinocrinis puniceicyclus]
MTSTSSTRRRSGRLALAAGTALALAIPLLAPAASHAASGESLTVDLASTRGAATGVGEGFLYGISQDGTQPSDQYLQPLNITAYRGGGHASGGWIADNYTYGNSTKADVNEILAQARRLTQGSYHAQYQVILSDMYGADGGQPSNTTFPCDNGNCSNWVGYIDSAVGALQASGLKFAYDIWNEPDISAFWTRGMNSTQYFQMWDTAYREIRKVAPSATIVGPSIAFTPLANPGEWSTWLSHVKSAGTVPDMITNHDEGDVDDPVAVSQALNNALSSAGISARPLSANEYQPADRQTAGVTAWYLARFAQSGYANAMRGNWVCCETPNLTGVLTNSGGSWQPTGNWWTMRDYADMTGTLVNTSGQVNSTAVSASEDSTNKRAVAIIGDSNGYTGSASVTFNGLATQPWLGSSVNVVVQRIPDQAPLSSPQVVLNQTMNASGGSMTVPFTFQASHDAFAVYLTPAGSSSGDVVTVTSPGNQSGAVGTPITAIQIQATDSAAGQSLVFGATSLPPGLSISSSGLITGTPTAGGTYTPIVVATDSSGAAGSTSFTWSVSGGSSGGSTGPLHAVGAGKCLDDPNSSTSGGTQQQIYTCNGAANQTWTHTSAGALSVTVNGTTMCLDANGKGTTAGTKAIIWSCNGQSNQQWNLNSNGTVTGVQSGLCLDVTGASTANGALVELWTCNGGSNQQWTLG